MIAMITTTATLTPTAIAPVLEDPSLSSTLSELVLLLLGVTVGVIALEVIVVTEVVVPTSY